VWGGKLARYKLHRGDVARLVTGSGGGFGDPLSRDVRLVQEDVQNELLTAAEAGQMYGVVIIPDSSAVDEASSNALRHELSTQRNNPHPV
jgi:N-methylhydantoinase B